MNKILWEIIKNFNGREEISVQELALAEATLDSDLFSIFTDHLEGKLKMSSEQWV